MTKLTIPSVISNANLEVSTQVPRGAAMNITIIGDRTGISFSQEDAWALHKWIEDNVAPLPERTILDHYREMEPGTQFRIGVAPYEFVKINNELVYRLNHAAADGDVYDIKGFVWERIPEGSCDLKLIKE